MNIDKKSYQLSFNMTLKEWLLYDRANIVFKKCYWMGVQVFKNPLDLWIYQEILYAVQPDMVIEIGCGKGGSTLYFASILDYIGKGAVIAIDIRNIQHRHKRIIGITGDSSSPEVIKRVSELCKDKIVLVNHDSNHNKEKVLRDLRDYSPFVSLNSYFIVEDGLVDLFEEPIRARIKEGPLLAIEQFLAENHNFVINKERERYIMTYCPAGYLKRIS